MTWISYDKVRSEQWSFGTISIYHCALIATTEELAIHGHSPDSVADPGGGCRGGRGPPALVIKKMAAKGGPIDFMFLAPPYLATGSDATGCIPISVYGLQCLHV